MSYAIGAVLIIGMVILTATYRKIISEELARLPEKEKARMESALQSMQ